VRAKRKKSLGRDVFDRPSDKAGAGALEKVLTGRGPRAQPSAKEIEVKIKLTPSNLKHLDAIRSRLNSEGKGRLSRNDLIRVAIALLSTEDF
jgi:hypothetical protein